MMFSHTLSQWLSRYRAFIGVDTIVSDPDSGRALGPASGTLWDVFPFLAPCAFSGLFAGLSVTGMAPSTGNVKLLEYRSRQGFRPVQKGPFSGRGWQDMTGEDWTKLNPTGFAPLENIPGAVHPVDLRFQQDGMEWSTADPAWTYFCRELSERYELHCWSHPDGLVVTSVCFTRYGETSRPFLRPCYVTDSGAEIDPACLFPYRKPAKLFGGLTILTAGKEVTLDAAAQADLIDDSDSLPSEPEIVAQNNRPNTTVVTVNKKASPRSKQVRTISGVPAGPNRNLSLVGAGSYRFVRKYRELDTETDRVTLVPHTLYLLGRDGPCCRCDDYVADYERVRELFGEQEELIGRYNNTYKKLQEIRDKLKTRIEEYAKSIRLRVESTEMRSDGIRCVFTLIYSNVRPEPYEHRPATIRLSSPSGLPAFQSVRVTQQPRDAVLVILAFSDTTLDVSSIRSPARTHLAVRLEAMLAGPGTEDFVLDILPQSEKE
ncbi:MAG TPA: hypothetical protein DEB39_14305 [Planctomycetaceae bacterium]|nr:hypothetical protein [Planctomycetaceae bacterium]